MTKANIVGSYPLSSMQQGMLLHSLDRSGTYIQQLICDLHEALDPQMFVQSWKEVSERHKVLRTGFRWEENPAAVQEVYDHVELPTLQQDWKELGCDLQQKKFGEYLVADRQRGFDVSVAPLMRLACFKLAEAHYRVVWTFHHALLDGRSHFAILREVFGLYDASANGGAHKLKARRPYGDYLDWLAKQDWSTAEVFWRTQLHGFKPPPDLPLRDDELTPSCHGLCVTETLRLSAGLSATLKQIAARNGITLNTLVQASWALLLSRYQGSEDIAFGATRACRHSTVPEAESMVGLFINTVPMRVSVPRNRSLLEWLKELRATQIALRDYENTPLPKIQKWSDAGGKSLFETVLVFENYELNEQVRQLEGQWKYRQFELLEQTHYPLALAAYSGASLLLKLEYDERRFNSTSITRMLAHVGSLLEGMAANLDRSVGALSMLTESERRQIVSEWNQTGRVFSDKCLHELFSEQTKRTPNAVAVVFEDEEITFDELNQRANQLAHHLIAQGVGPEVLIGVLLERSIEMVVGLLAILKAGGAYLPLDSSYPRERLAFILADAGVKILLTQQRLDPDAHGSEAIYLDDERFSSQSVADPRVRVRADNPAYALYTSGSTGKPKGVLITHHAISNHMQWMQQEFPLVETDCVLQKTPVTFDASVWEFYAPLLSGARLIMARPDGHKSAAYLIRTIQRYQVTTLQLVPSLLHLLLDDPAFAQCHSLKRVFCGGEPLTRELVDRFAAYSKARLINLYGPTETCIDATFWTDEGARRVSSIPIGRPISNMSAYVLDSMMAPVPVGISGELYLGGAGLARGYVHRPDLTADRFVPDPFSHAAGARLYRTGDIARYLPDGNIAYMGRADHQVKLHGVRIELGEIESVLAQHPHVRQCVAALRADRDGQSRLSAYFVAGSEPPNINDLRAFVRTRLPESMVPSSFVPIEKLPLTESGKIDRAALPAPQFPRENSAYVAPRDAAEETVAKIWSEVLKLDRVGVLDDFLELGGDSLQAMQVISRTAAAFQIDLTLDVFFRSKTIAGLAAALQEALIEEVSQIAEDEG